MANSTIKWIGLIIILGSFPIWGRFIVSTYPDVSIDKYNLADLLFFGISLHTSILYELLTLKNEIWFITIFIIFFIVGWIFYIIYTVLVILLGEKYDILNVVIYAVFFSIFLSITIYIVAFLQKGNINRG